MFEPTQNQLVNAAEKAWREAERGQKLASVGLGHESKDYVDYPYTWGTIRVFTRSLANKAFPFRYRLDANGELVKPFSYEPREAGTTMKMAMPFHIIMRWKAWLLVTAIISLLSVFFIQSEISLAMPLYIGALITLGLGLEPWFGPYSGGQN